MRKNLDDSFTYELGLNSGIFQNENIPRYRWIKPVSLFSEKQTYIFKGFLYQHFIKKLSNAFSIVGILQYLSYKLFLYHRDSKLSKEDMKKTLTLLFLFNAEVRYALQLRHLSSKIQSGYVTRKSRIGV